MNKTVKRALRRSRANSEYYVANNRCLTPDARYITKIKPHKIICKIKLPPSVRLKLSSTQAEMLDEELHRALERVLAKFFNN
tara:strand:- start:206 stop:451 length:246 start_codon:yes stop_codon:yes gene_type:complete